MWVFLIHTRKHAIIELSKWKRSFLNDLGYDLAICGWLGPARDLVCVNDWFPFKNIPSFSSPLGRFPSYGLQLSPVLPWRGNKSLVCGWDFTVICRSLIAVTLRIFRMLIIGNQSYEGVFYSSITWLRSGSEIGGRCT